MRRLLVLGLTVVLLSGCKGGPNAPSGQTETITGTVAGFLTDVRTISITKTGTLTLTLTWTPSASVVDLDLYLTSSSCTAFNPFFNNSGTCAFLAAAQSATASTETVTRAVTSGETYKFFVDNFSTGTGTWTVKLSVP